MEHDVPTVPKEEVLLSAVDNRSLSGRKPRLTESKKNHYIPLEEALEVMRAKEKRYRITPTENKHERHCRGILVDWMAQVGDGCSLQNITVHTAVALLDRILFTSEVSRSRYQLVACCSILLASKLCEIEDLIPTVEELNYCTDNTYSPEMIVQMEAILLNHLRWDINIISAAHFLEFFLTASLNEDTDRHQDQFIIDPARLLEDVKKTSSFFVDMSRQDYQFVGVLPSIIAASSIALTRRLLKIAPVWSKELKAITLYDYSDIAACVDLLWSGYTQTFLKTTSGT